MQALMRKARADLLGRGLQHGLVFIVVAGAGAMLTLSLLVYRSATLAFERTFVAANGAHVWFAANSAEDLTPLRVLAGITEANVPFPAVWGSFTLALAAEPDPLALWGLPAERLAVGQPVMVAGRWLTAGMPDEVVLDQGLARLRGVAPGDQLPIQTRAGQVTLTVVGLAVNAARPAYPASSPALGYVLPETLRRLEPDTARWGWLLGVRLFAGDAASVFIDQARAAYPSRAGISATPWQWVRDEVNDSAFFNVLFLGVFGAFALLAAAFVITNLVGGQVAAQTREIGLLKAVGCTPIQVSGLFVIEQAVLGALAALAGAGLGVLLAPPFLTGTAAILGAVPATAIDPPLLVTIVLGVTLLVAGLTLLPAWRGGRISAVQALTVPLSHTPVPAFRLAGFAARLRLSPVVALGLRTALQNRGRAVLTLGSAAVAIVTATFTLSAEATLAAALKDPTVIGGAPYSVEVRRVDFVTGRVGLPAAEAEQLLAAQPGVAGTLSFVNVGVRLLPRAGQADAPGFMSFAVGGDVTRFRFYLPEGRMFSAPGEAILSGALADELGVHLGDTLTLRVLAPSNGQLVDTDQTFTVRYVGRYAASGDGGRRLLYSLETYQQQVAPDAAPERYGLVLARGADPEAVKAEIERAAGGRLSVTVNDLRPGVDAVRGVLWPLTAVLLSIAAINLLATLWLGVHESSRDFAIFKTTGLTPRQVALTVLVGSVALSAAASTAVPLGLLVTRVLFDLIAASLNLGRGLFALPSLLSLLGLVPLTLLVAAAGAAMPAHLAARVPVVEALQSH